MPKEESEQKVQEFENSVAKELERNQAELESRLIKQHLKWVLPWFQSMKATELLHYTQIHAVHFFSLFGPVFRLLLLSLTFLSSFLPSLARDNSH